MTQPTFFVDVILPLAVPNLYTYRVPVELNDSIQIGQRAVVQLGRHKLYTAVIKNIHQKAPQEYTAKYILEIIDAIPIINKFQLSLWDWLSQYYLCTIGEVMNAALPSGLKLESESQLILHPDFSENKSILSEKEELIVKSLRNRVTIPLKEIPFITNQKTVYPLIQTLIEKKIIGIKDEIKNRYKPKTIEYVRITEKTDNENQLKYVFDQLAKAPKQLEIVMAYIHLSKRYTSKSVAVKKQELLKKANTNTTTLNLLIKKNIFSVYEEEEGRLFSSEQKSKNTQDKELSNDQQKVLENIKIQFEEKDVVLLHGVTSSGKTAIYIKLIEETLKKGKQVLYLLPEIALTTQIISRLRNFFGNKVGVYHSRFNENERVEIWNAVAKYTENSDEKQPFSITYPIILGARSAIFLPYNNLDLIIVDEEHENSFKQYSPSPRYQARDTAIMLAKIHKAKVLLGSATPSIETYWNAQNNKYGKVELAKRFGNMQMPEIIISDLKDATQKKLMKTHFSPLLLNEIKLALLNKEQVILFRNRRGFAPLLNCEICDWIPKCHYCDVILTYHKQIDRLKCHYCGYTIKPLTICNACGSDKLKLKGYGTEKIEEDLSIFFPEAKIARMDWDTTRKKNAYHNIISDFENQEIDILVGTQMITKGLDFDNVALVAILNADSMLYFPDFRAFEKSYQLMAQVAGRAGRKNKRGKVIIQTYSPQHIVIKNVINNDYVKMYQNEIIERERYNYPPFYRLIQLTVKHKDINHLNNGAAILAESLKKHFGKRVFGPEFPVITRIQNQYQKNILIKIKRDLSITRVKNKIQELLHDFKIKKDWTSIQLILDVDPM